MKKKTKKEVKQVSKNSELLGSFVRYCLENPEMRFWQALNNWSGVPNLVVMDINGKMVRDTFYWENRNN